MRGGKQGQMRFSRKFLIFWASVIGSCNSVKSQWMKRGTFSQATVCLTFSLFLLTFPHSGRADGLLDAVSSQDMERAVAELAQNPGAVNRHKRDQSNGQTPLHLAALNRDLPMMALLLDHGANPEIADNDGVTPLQLSAEFDRKESADLLLARGAKADIISAAMLDRLDLARRALTANPTILNVRSHYGRTPLHWAVRANFQAMSAWLLEKGANPNLQDVSGYTPLQETIWGGYSEIARLLMARKANPNLPDNQGRTPLHRVTDGIDPQRNLEIAALLLANGADLEARDVSDYTPLFAAERNAKITALLLAGGADPNAHSKYGLTPLGAANSPEVLQILLNADANMRYSDANGLTPLHFLAGSGNAALVRLALLNGANPRALTLTGRSPLHFAADRGNLEVVELLVRNGANVNAVETISNPPSLSTRPDKTAEAGAFIHRAENRTPLREAALARHFEVVKYLRAHGAVADIFAAVALGDAATLTLLLKQEPRSVNLLASNGETPLLMAAETGDEALIKLLLEAGADPSVRAPQLYAGGAAELAQSRHHETSAALIRAWTKRNAAKIIRP